MLVGRLDNLAMSFCSTKALADACSSPQGLEQERGVRAIALFDHEECGSGSAQGAVVKGRVVEKFFFVVCAPSSLTILAL